MQTCPSNNLGLRHLALTVKNFEDCLIFYRDLLGMKIEWQPDNDNVYLTTGSDNLALHRAANLDSTGDKNQKAAYQALDHLGFILKTPEDVDIWFDFFQQNHVTLKNKPRTHRDGAKSFYCQDPDGNNIQMIYHPPLSD